jgi:hypothetical protein
VEFNSSKKILTRALARQLDKFLVEFANMQQSDRLIRKFSSLLPPNLQSAHDFSPTFTKNLDELPAANLRAYQELVQAVWEAPTNAQRRYFGWKLRSRLYLAVEAMAREAIPQTIQREGGEWHRVREWKLEYSTMLRSLQETPFEAALDRLDDLRERTKRCSNPDCPAPFFIAVRKSQRYCTESCAGVFQRQAKQAWWQRHGREWREQRREETGKGRRHGKARTK